MMHERTVALLGLGRMGTAVAHRLTRCGWDVRTWSRSGRTVDGLTGFGDPTQAATGTAYVVLCLYDGGACRETLAATRTALGPGQVVVNLSTIAPAEAGELDEIVTAAGATYVHAPVIGSVRPAADGRLTVLVGIRPGTGEPPAAELLADLGEPVPCGDAAGAARAKLVANAALAGSLLTVSDAATAAIELGLPASATYDTLERSPLGRLVSAKRARLDDDDFERADFTAGALRKDVALLTGSAAGADLLARLDQALRGTATEPGHDVGALARARSEQRVPRTAREHGLSISGDVDVPDAVLAPLVAYAAGHATGDPAHFRRAFLSTAHVEGLRNGRFVSWDLDEYCANFTGRPAEYEATRRRRVEHVAVTGTVGTATMVLRHGADTFTDVFLLALDRGTWRIANKVYHRSHAG